MLIPVILLGIILFIVIDVVPLNKSNVSVLLEYIIVRGCVIYGTYYLITKGLRGPLVPRCSLIILQAYVLYSNKPLI